MTKTTIDYGRFSLTFTPLPSAPDAVVEVEVAVGDETATERLSIDEARHLRDQLEEAGNRGHESAGLLENLF